MKKNITALFVLLTLLLSCQKNPEKIERECLIQAIEHIGVSPRYQWVIVLPGLGCHGCIQETEYFMKTHLDDERILFILTNTSSLKILEQKTEIRIAEHPNIYVDRDNLFHLPTANTVYPCIIELKEGKILNHSFQSPRSAALDKLDKKLQ